MPRPPESRRQFLKKSLAAGMAAGVGLPATSQAASLHLAQHLAGPVVIASGNGLAAVERAMEEIQAGNDALEAVVAGVGIVEADPNDLTVGYGGLPNADGIVELDACVMHGPTGRAGGVAALRNIKHPAQVAKYVLERTDHVLLVGEGALRFAKMHGFPEENLLTERARQLWVRWRETLSNRDDYLPPHGIEDRDIGALIEGRERPWGTIHSSAIDLGGNISSVTTTSGLAFKIPGRVGDSPIIGAGLYTDNAVGAAGSTGRGEANLENLSSFLIVERMRAGDHPKDACLYACRRIAEQTRLARLKDESGRPNFNVQFYALNAKGEVGGAEIRGGGSTMAVATAAGAQQVEMAVLYEQ